MVVLITSFHLRNSKIWQRRMFLSPSMTTMVLMCGVRDVVGNVGTIVFSPIQDPVSRVLSHRRISDTGWSARGERGPRLTPRPGVLL